MYFPSEGRRGEDFFFALKNPTASAGLDPANLVIKGQQATSRPLKPLRRVCCISFNAIDSSKGLECLFKSEKLTV